MKKTNTKKNVSGKFGFICSFFFTHESKLAYDSPFVLISQENTLTSVCKFAWHVTQWMFEQQCFFAIFFFLSFFASAIPCSAD